MISGVEWPRSDCIVPSGVHTEPNIAARLRRRKSHVTPGKAENAMLHAHEPAKPRTNGDSRSSLSSNLHGPIPDVGIVQLRNLKRAGIPALEFRISLTLCFGVRLSALAADTHNRNEI